MSSNGPYYTNSGDRPIDDYSNEDGSGPFQPQRVPKVRSINATVSSHYSAPASPCDLDLQPTIQPLSRDDTIHEHHVPTLLNPTARPYYFPAPVGHSQPLPPAGAPRCGCWEYMPIGEHDPQNHGMQASEERYQQIVNAQAERERVVDCVCQAMGWPSGWHSRWVHGLKQKKGEGEGFEMTVPIRTSTKRTSEAQVKGEGAAAEGSSAGAQKRKKN